MAVILEVKDLVTKFYTLDGVVNAVNGVSFTLDEGETLAVVGESGSGKSVSMMSVMGLISSPPGKVESGEALFYTSQGARDLLKLSPNEMNEVRGGQIGFVFQDPQTSLNPILKVGEQISESLMKHLGINARDARLRTLELLAEVGISDPELRYDAYPFQMSGGMRQRVMIAIAVACTPRIVIADEPTTSLDVTIQAQIVNLFKQLRAKMGVATIWITHDLGTCPSKMLPLWRKCATASSIGKKPSRPSVAYTPGDVWPWLTTMRSRSGSSGLFGSTFASAQTTT